MGNCDINNQFCSNLPSLSALREMGSQFEMPEVDPRLQTIATKALNYGENLTTVQKYSAYIPGAPALLKSNYLKWTGDTCRLINSGIKIKNKMDRILSSESSLETKTQDVLDISKQLLSMVDTEYATYLPDNVRARLNWMNKACNVAKLGLSFKTKLDDVSNTEDNSYEKQKEKLVAAQIAINTAYQALDLVSNERNWGLKGAMWAGSGLAASMQAGLNVAAKCA